MYANIPDIHVNVPNDAMVAKWVGEEDIDDDVTSGRLLSILSDLSRIQTLSHPNILTLHTSKRFKENLYLFVEYFPHSLPLSCAFDVRSLLIC